MRWDLPDDLILASGLGASYDPRSYRVHYKGNRSTVRPPTARGRPMSADETIGVAAAARLLRCLCETRRGDRKRSTRRRSAFVRSTAFVVAAGLEAMGLVERDSRGRLRAGPAATRLGLAYYGFGAMADAAEALLPVLRDDTDTSVSLIVSKGTSEFEAARRRATWARDADAGGQSDRGAHRAIERRLFGGLASISTPDCDRNRAPLGQCLRGRVSPPLWPPRCRRRTGLRHSQ